ncbi:AbrB/MazE/SpoVT family DNA-binding domain-containing protein [Chitinimonas lacunae]|uniref:AbrB/MazE/SpoVT family DNA-binding domain-containing protein n=1 Tax=Chitinimonas lacunae TaxID=1963018 RepID=A0ABV8MXG0_9NEIS
MGTAALKTEALENAWTATVTTKGQVTIPAGVRVVLQVDAGDRLDFIRLEDGRIMVAAANKDVTCLKGRLKKLSKPVTVEEMNEAIAAGGAGEE